MPIAADIFRQAADLNRGDRRRVANQVTLDNSQEVIVAGDIHGHRGNLTRIISFAKLDGSPGRTLVLQEIIHGPPDERTGHDRSVDLLLRAARLKIAHPAQVLFVLGNHDLAQVTGNEITKDGCGVCKAFTEGVRFAFGAETDEVLAAIHGFLLSMPLTVRCPNRALIAHSVPSPERMKLTGHGIPEDAYEGPAIRRGGAVYEWLWGRNQDAPQMEHLAAMLDVEFFVLGHRPAEDGFHAIPPRTLILASDHDDGQVMVFRTGDPLNMETATASLRPISRLDRQRKE